MTKQTKQQLTFTNSAGDTFKILPMNPLERDLIQQQLESEWQAAGKVLPELPVYDATTVTGEVQHIQVKSREDAEKAGILDKWEAYEQADTEFNKEFGNRFLVSLFLCVDANPNDYPRWLSTMRVKHFTVPDDELEKLVLFGKTWVTRSSDDIAELTFAVAVTTGNMNEETREAAKAKFRAFLEAQTA